MTKKKINTNPGRQSYVNMDDHSFTGVLIDLARRHLAETEKEEKKNRKSKKKT